LQAEAVDINAKLHGNWTLQNAKMKLHECLQRRKMTADYKYEQIGPDHNKLVNCLTKKISEILPVISEHGERETLIIRKMKKKNDPTEKMVCPSILGEK
jgi:hypothetical protein